MKVNSLILASGAGSRLYPISTEDHPKQFLPLLNDNEMMVNVMNRRLKNVVDDQYTVTLKKYEKFISDIKSHVFAEPQRAGTGFSLLYGLLNIKEIEGDCLIVQAPSDHHIGNQDELERAISKGIRKCSETDKIILIGQKPTREETEYGYFWEGDHGVGFYEKPDMFLAKALKNQGAYWNTAIYVYRLSTMIHLFKRFKRSLTQELYYAINSSLDETALIYNGYEPFSFEKEILTKVRSLDYVIADLKWEDIGALDRLNKVRGDYGREKIKIDERVNKRS